MASEPERIDEQLRRSLEGEAWHGPALLEVLAGVTHLEAAEHPIAGAHSIWELVLHLGGTYGLVLRRLGGDGRQLTKEEDWPLPPPATQEAWAETVERLRQLNHDLRRAVGGFKAERLDDRLVPEAPYTAYTQLIGVTQHDLYHAGQMAILKRALLARRGGGVLTPSEREAIAAIWSEKLSQDARDLPKTQRHRNLEPASAEFVCALAAGCRARRLLEVGGSSGLSTIALAAAARQTGGRLVSIEIEPARQAMARKRLASLGLSDQVDFVLADAGQVLGQYDALELALIDCEKEDYERFLALLRLAPGAVVVADNILSHDLRSYVSAVRSYPGVESVTLAIGKGLEVSRFVNGWAGQR